CLATRAQGFDFQDELRVSGTVRHKRRELLNLSFCLQYGFVSPIQIVEMCDQCLDARLHIRSLEHVSTHEICQVPDGVHRHGLMKQFQRLVVLNAEAAAKVGTVWRKALEDFGSTAPELLSQVPNVRSEVGEISGNRKLGFSGNEKTSRLSLNIFEP